MTEIKHKLIPISALSGVLLLAGCAQDGVSVDNPGPVAAHWQVLERYCYDCHNNIDRAADLVLDRLHPDNVAADAATWELVLRKLRGDLMPPPDRPRPDREAQDLFVAAFEQRLAEVAEASGPRPGYVGLHRLNRTEYGNAVRDLLNVDVDATTLLPRDDSRDGYDNIASVLSVSPTFIEQYVAAARTVAQLALGDAQAGPGSTTYVSEGSASDRRHIAGLPLGTRGGLAVTHHFPADGEYRINVADMAQALWVFNMEFEHTLLVLVDGREVYRTLIGGDEDMKAIDQHDQSAADFINERLKNIAFEATAGPRQVAVTFLARSFAESDDRLQILDAGGGQDRILNISSFEIQGPFNPTGVSDTPSRRLVFSCHPGGEADSTQAAQCAQEILGRLARRAYRRPVTDADMERLMRFYDGAAASGGFENGVRGALTAILASPEFLYRFTSPEDVRPGAIHTLSDVELASRLSFFLWSSIPDEELLAVAEQGRLGDPQVLEAQVQRMLADDRAGVLVSNFAFQWLNVAALDDVEPDRQVFPHIAGVDPRDAYRRELELFMRSILLEDRPIMELLTAGHTYVNETVARMYGIHDVRGDQFRRVELENPLRHGLLGKGAVLMATSYPNRTAPVLRGEFILDHLMGSPPAPPPPDVDTNLADDRGEAPRTVRERLAEHRRNPSCNSCHGMMDPLGLALENFNAIGEWREFDELAGVPIDASGELVTGQYVAGPLDLREALVSEPVRFARTVTEGLMTYALGRSLEYYDMPVVRRIVSEAGRDDHRLSSLIVGIVRSDAFRLLEVPDAAETPAVASATDLILQ